MGKSLLIWMMLFSIFITFFSEFDFQGSGKQVNYSEFIKKVNNKEVAKIDVNGYSIKGIFIDGSSFETTRPAIIDTKLMDDLIKNEVQVFGVKQEGQSLWKQLIVAIFPTLIFLGIFIFIMRKMNGGGKGGMGGGNPFSFGKSKAKLFEPNEIKTKFKDVAGSEEAKEDLQDIVEFLKNPMKFYNMGGKIPRGVLMSGPPGTGKTLLAKAVAGEAEVPFYFISGSDFVEMFVGVGASRVRAMFSEARKKSPCIIFIDEIDAVGRKRGSGVGGGNDEREQTLNQILVEMDGFDSKEGVIVIAATNRIDVLDNALLRPGRFDRRVYVGLPDMKGRDAILNVHSSKVPLAKDVVFADLARGTPGFSGADLANLINEGVLLAAKLDKKVVSMEHFESAKDKILMGAGRKSMVMSEKERLNTAHHESGHAILGKILPEHDPVYKVSILPRSGALGVTMFLPNKDKYSMSKQAIFSSICSLFGGRIAEEMILGEELVTTGAENDIQRATQLAKKMVIKWGLSVLGPLDYSSTSQSPFGESESKEPYEYSQQTLQKIDAEVKKILDASYKKAYALLKENKDKLITMAQALMTYETINEKQIEAIMNGEDYSKVDSDVWDKPKNDKKTEDEE